MAEQDPNSNPTEERGFTLVELMIVVAIIAVLAAIAIVGYSKFVEDGKKTKAEAFLMVVKGKQELYNSRFGRFLTAPANPSTVPSDGGKVAWETNASWVSLGASPRSPLVGWQYQTGGGTGACAAGGGGGQPPADMAAACAGLTAGTWFWAGARNDKLKLVTNSARNEVWEVE